MRRGAFTLVELLVVIAIIGLLSTVAVISLNSARMKARDTKRIADLKQIRLALSMYYNDNGFYPPPSGTAWDFNTYTYSNNWDSSFVSALASYLSPLPKDPLNSSCAPWSETPCYNYAYGNVGRYTYPKTYDLAARLEDPNHPERCGVKGWKFGEGAGYDFYWCTAFGGGYTDQMYEIAPAD